MPPSLAKTRDPRVRGTHPTWEATACVAGTVIGKGWKLC